MKPNITVAEVMDRELELKNSIQKLLTDFKNETGFYVERVDVDYYSSFTCKHDVVIVDIESRINY